MQIYLDSMEIKLPHCFYRLETADPSQVTIWERLEKLANLATAVNV